MGKKKMENQTWTIDNFWKNQRHNLKLYNRAIVIKKCMVLVQKQT